MKGVVSIKPYTEFINEIYKCIIHTFDSKDNAVRIFCEGPDQSLYSGSQEYAVLRNEYARFFFDTICNNDDLPGIRKEEFVLKSSPIYPGEIKLVHSCYPKNVRRWLKGTISRKRKCRIEFCVLVWCHAMGWKNESVSDEKLDSCRNQITEICRNYIEIDEANQFSFEMIWRAASSAYEQSYR